MSAELVCRADDPQWLAERRKGVTATDIPAILGLSSYDSLYAAYWRKMSDYADPADNDRLRLGRRLEPYITELWQKNSGLEATIAPHLWRSKDRPWQLATPDRQIAKWGDAHEDEQPGWGEPIECKSWGTTDGWGPDGSDIMPLTVRAQVLWQMDVLGSAAGHVAVVFLPSGEFRSYRIDHAWHESLAEQADCQVCKDQRTMRAAGVDFWRRVTELDPPTADGSAATLAALKARFGKPDKCAEIEIGYALMAQWQHWRAMEKEGEANRKTVEAHMREKAGDAGVYLADGQPFARRERFTAHVKAHDRVTDRLMPVKPREDNDNAAE